MSKKHLLLIVMFVTLAAVAVFSVAALAGDSAAAPATSTDAATGTDARPVESFWDTVPEGAPVLPFYPLPVAGDLDGSGEWEPSDARLALRYSVGLTQELEPDQHQRLALWLVDVDGDGKATPADARRILRAAVGLDDCRLPDPSWDVYRLRADGLGFEYDQLGALKALAVNADRVTGPFDDNAHLPLWRIDSFTELRVWLDAFAAVDARLELCDGERSYSQLADAEVPAFLKRYSEAFFAENDLLICDKYEGSGSYAQAVYAPAVQGGALTLTVRTAYVTGAGGTADMANWLLFVPVAKTLTAKCGSFDCFCGAPLPLAAETAEEVLFGCYQGYQTEWMYAYSKLLTEKEAFLTLVKGEAPQGQFSLLNAQDGGYLWECEADEGIEVRDAYVRFPQERGAAGAPSLQEFFAVAEKPGTYTLRLRLKRPWETESIDERTVTVTVE